MTLTNEFDPKVFTHSDTADRLKIDNTPPADVVEKLHDLYEHLLQPLMAMLPGQFVVSSGYRCNKLNAAVKGQPTSQHIKGEAADIQYSERGVMRNMVLYDALLKSGLEYDQCIREFPDRTGNPRWIHLSYRKGANRKMTFEIKK